MTKIKAIIYDLDNTIFPTSGIRSNVADPVINAIKQSNDGHLDEQQISDMIADCYRLSIRDVIQKYSFSQKMIAAAYHAFSTLTFDYQLEMYPDYNCVKEIAGLRFLVTSGHHDFQLLKIENLKISADFEAVFIHDNEKSSGEGKIEIFNEILHQYQLEKHEVMVIGDNPKSEIAAGNYLGMPTVQILRDGVTKSSEAEFHINDFHELKELVKPMHRL